MNHSNPRITGVKYLIPWDQVIAMRILKELVPDSWEPDIFHTVLVDVYWIWKDFNKCQSYELLIV